MDRNFLQWRIRMLLSNSWSEVSRSLLEYISFSTENNPLKCFKKELWKPQDYAQPEQENQCFSFHGVTHSRNREMLFIPATLQCAKKCSLIYPPSARETFYWGFMERNRVWTGGRQMTLSRFQPHFQSEPGHQGGSGCTAALSLNSLGSKLARISLERDF